MMHQNATVLFKFSIPELSSFPIEEQQRVLTACWESAAVQSAWHRYWSRPTQWPLFPAVPLAIYSEIAKVSWWKPLLVLLPVVPLVFLPTRAYYKRQLTSVLRIAVLERLPPDKPLKKD